MPSPFHLAHLHLETREPESSPPQGRETRRGRCRWSRSVRISRNRDLAGQVHRRKEGPQLMHNGRQDVTVTGSRTAPCPTGTGRQPSQIRRCADTAPTREPCWKPCRGVCWVLGAWAWTAGMRSWRRRRGPRDGSRSSGRIGRCLLPIDGISGLPR